MNILDLFPLSTTVHPRSGGLRIAGHDLNELAHRWGTPLYLYDAATVRAQASGLQRLLTAVYPGPGLVAYAAKAYFSLGFARQVAALGLGADVVSLGELSIARKAGFDPATVHLHGNNKTAEELAAALRWGVQAIVVDSQEELDILESLAARFGSVPRIWLRITPGLNVHTHPYRQTGHNASKFGLPVQDGQAAEGIRRAQRSQWLRLTGLHTHLGSQLFDPEPYQEAILSLCRLAQETGFVPEEISPGGGWGVPYHPGDEASPVENWVNAVSQTLVTACQSATASSAAPGARAGPLAGCPGRCGSLHPGNAQDPGGWDAGGSRRRRPG